MACDGEDENKNDDSREYKMAGSKQQAEEKNIFILF